MQPPWKTTRYAEIPNKQTIQQTIFTLLRKTVLAVNHGNNAVLIEYAIVCNWIKNARPMDKESLAQDESFHVLY